MDVAAPHHPSDPLEKAQRLIADRLFEPLSLGDLARASGLSPYHFSRQFTARFGQSVMAHIRMRRIAAAAARLSTPTPPRVVDLAFECGFDSQEGFTRAFKRAFGVSPARFGRGERRPQERTPAMSTPTAPRLALSQSAQPVLRPQFTVAGLAGWFDETTKATIPDLWGRFIQALPPGGLSGCESFGVCWGAEAEGMNYMAAVAWPADQPAPPGLKTKVIPAQSYLVFRQIVDGGPLHPQMQAATREIWGERVPKSGHALAAAPDLEVYPPDFRPDLAGAFVEWWIPVRV